MIAKTSNSRQASSYFYRDEKYLQFIRRQRCCICECNNYYQAFPTEAHHVAKRHGKGRVNDYMTIPLCREHHNQVHIEGWTSVADGNLLPDVSEFVMRYNHQYIERSDK